MDIIQNFFSEFPELSALLYDVIKGFVFLIGFLVYKKTGNKKLLKEVLDKMKYRTENYQATEKVAGQTFSQFIPVYRLNKQTNELELTDEVIDQDALVNSCKTQCLDAVMERFFPQQLVDDKVAICDSLLDDLDMAFEFEEKMMVYKKQFGLDPTLSNEQTIAFLKAKANSLKEEIKNMEVSSNEEKKIDEESK